MIVEIVILTEYQCRGIGTQVLLEEISRARALNVPTMLRVLKENRAALLYNKLGFQEYDRTETHILMKWKDNQAFEKLLKVEPQGNNYVEENQ